MMLRNTILCMCLLCPVITSRESLNGWVQNAVQTCELLADSESRQYCFDSIVASASAAQLLIDRFSLIDIDQKLANQSRVQSIMDQCDNENKSDMCAEMTVRMKRHTEISNPDHYRLHKKVLPKIKSGWFSLHRKKLFKLEKLSVNALKISFNMSILHDFAGERSLQQAELHFAVRQPKLANQTLGTNVTVKLFAFVDETEMSTEPMIETILTIPSDHKTINHWVSVDLTNLVADWVEHQTQQSQNHGLFIKVQPADSALQQHEENSQLWMTDLDEQWGSMLEVQFREPISELAARVLANERQDDVTDCNSAEQKGCCRRYYEVNFTSLGLNYIIAPRVYRGYYCAGDCSRTEHTRQMMISRAMRLNQPAMDTPDATGIKFKSCCAPEEHDSMSMLYMLDDGTIKQEIIPDMIVRKCSCS